MISIPHRLATVALLAAVMLTPFASLPISNCACGAGGAMHCSTGAYLCVCCIERQADMARAMHDMLREGPYIVKACGESSPMAGSAHPPAVTEPMAGVTHEYAVSHIQMPPAEQRAEGYSPELLRPPRALLA